MAVLPLCARQNCSSACLTCPSEQLSLALEDNSLQPNAQRRETRRSAMPSNSPPKAPIDTISRCRQVPASVHSFSAMPAEQGCSHLAWLAALACTSILSSVPPLDQASAGLDTCAYSRNFVSQSINRVECCITQCCINESVGTAGMRTAAPAVHAGCQDRQTDLVRPFEVAS